jgi:enoyl-CoA hydratase
MSTTPTSAGSVSAEMVGPVAVLTLDRPPMNALDIPFCESIAAAIDSAVAEEQVRAVVLTGAGPAFSAGVDLQIVPDLDTAAQDALIDALNHMVLTLYGAPLPVLAAVNGHAIAGGLVLALCADYRVAAPTGRHGLTEVAVGVRFPASTREAVLAELETRAVRRLVFSGDLISSAEAEALGAYDEVAADPLERALEVAQKWAAHPRAIYGDIKTAIRGETLGRMSRVPVDGDPLKGSWLSDEMREMARARLAR